MQRHGIHVELTGGDHPMVTKRSSRPTGIARLRAEAAFLNAARHPGVVPLVDCQEVEVDGASQVVLRTRLAGSRTLATHRAVGATRAAAIVAFLASTVTDLHAMGIVHGRITPDHVVVAADGRPVLCGFGSARRTRGDDDGPAHDVAALGELLRHLLDTVAPANRSSGALARRGDVQVKRALLDLTDEATHLDPNRRPTARRLADAIHRVVPTAALEPQDDHHGVEVPRRAADSASEATAAPPVPQPERTDPRRRRLVGATAAAAAVVLLAVAWGGASSDSTPSTPAEPASAPASAPTTGAADLSPTTTQASPDPAAASASGCATDAADGSTSIGAPCPAPLSFDAGVLTVGEQRFAIDLADASVAIGDFACRGTVQAGLVDRATGAVFVFDALASAAVDVSAERLETVASPRQVLAEPLDGGCHRLVVLDKWGLRHIVSTATDEVSPTTSTTQEVEP